MQQQKRACDVVDEATLWHLVAKVSDKYSPSNARHTWHASAEHLKDEHCAPVDQRTMLAKSRAQLRQFQQRVGLPFYMSLADVGALHTLTIALSHNLPESEHVRAVKAISGSYKSIYKVGLPLEVKKRLAVYLKETASALNDEEHLALASHFRHNFVAQKWQAFDAMRYAKAWQHAFRVDEDEAKAWSAYLYVQAACGVLDRDAAYVQRVANNVGGVGGFDKKHIEALLKDVENLSQKRTVDDLINVSQALLMQAAHVHEHSTEKDSRNI